MTNTNTLDPEVFTDAETQAKLIVRDFSTLKGPVDSFIPKGGNAKLQREIEVTGLVQPGAFRDCALFDDTSTATLDQKRLRRITPVACFAVRLIEERLDENHGSAHDSIAWRLMDYAVSSARDQSTMVEAAKQYFDMEKAGTLYVTNDAGAQELSQDARFLVDQLNQAQDRIYPQLSHDLAEKALYRAEHPNEPIAEAIMSQETREEWYTFLHERFDPVFDEVFDRIDPDDEPIIGERLREMTEAFMRASGLPIRDNDKDFSKWKCEYKDDSSGFRVKSNEKLVICGTRDEPLTRAQFEKLMMHEIVVHAWRAENGSRTGYPAFQVGLPGYLEPEEGLGLLIEALWTGESPESLSRDHLRYVAVSYADGVYDGIKHSEQETYDYMRVLVSVAGFGNDTAELYRHIMRPYRGMPTGCIMRSNASYLAGKEAMMEDLETKHRAGISVEEIFTALQAVKSNPLDPDHEELRRAVARVA